MGIGGGQLCQTKLKVRTSFRAETGIAPKAVITNSRVGATNNGCMEMAMTIGTTVITIRIKRGGQGNVNLRPYASKNPADDGALPGTIQWACESDREMQCSKHQCERPPISEQLNEGEPQQLVLQRPNRKLPSLGKGTV